MAKNEFTNETIENYQQKCCCVLVLDVSSSMTGKAILELNKGLEEFHKEISDDQATSARLEISIITFGSKVECLVEPSLIQNFKMPVLEPQGTTKLVEGVRAGISKVDLRKKWYKKTGQPYYRPWIILITDGEPDSDQDVEGLALQIKSGMDNKTFHFYAVGVEGANMNVLNDISHNKMPPAKLSGFKFAKFFKWLSQSMECVINSSEGQSIDLPNPDWMMGFLID